MHKNVVRLLRCNLQLFTMPPAYTRTFLHHKIAEKYKNDRRRYFSSLNQKPRLRPFNNLTLVRAMCTTTPGLAFGGFKVLLLFDMLVQR